MLTAVALPLVVGLVAGCSSSGHPDSSSGGQSGSSGSPIKIGGTLGLTGALSVTAGEYLAVYKYWAEKVNASGGLLGRKVQLDIENDNSTAATAQTEYQTLLTKDNVDLLLAPYATFVGAPIVPLARSAGKILFNGGFVSQSLFDSADGWMLSTYTYQEPDYTRGVFEALQALPAAQRPTKVGILTNNNPFTLAVRDGYNGTGGALNFAKQAGMQVVYNQTYGSDTTDFTSAVTQAKAAGVQLFLILGLPDDEDSIVKTEKVLGFTPQLTCVCGSQDSTLPNWGQLGDATQGVVGTTTAWPRQPYNGLNDVAAFTKSRGESVIPSYDATAYASLQVIQQAVEGAKTLDQTKLKAYIYSHTFDTAVGDLKFNSNGTTSFAQVLTQTVDGQTRPVWPAAVAQAQLKLGAGGS
jgi:branched-chain amino acid transport system substrate-binding protein